MPRSAASGWKVWSIIFMSLVNNARPYLNCEKYGTCRTNRSYQGSKTAASTAQNLAGTRNGNAPPKEFHYATQYGETNKKNPVIRYNVEICKSSVCTFVDVVANRENICEIFFFWIARFEKLEKLESIKFKVFKSGF